MYSIFNTKVKNCKYLEEGEPPPKKHVTEKDVLIKQLSENQLKTEVNLTEELKKEKPFTSSETFTNITTCIKGKTELEEFKTKVADIEELNILKGKNLSDKDLVIYRDYRTLGSNFLIKYKGIREDVLYKRINEIKETIASSEASYHNIEDVAAAPFCQKYEHKSSSEKQNGLKKIYLSGPMDELPSLEKQVMSDIEQFSKCDIKKIRKKARSINKRINKLDIEKSSVISAGSLQNIIKPTLNQRSTLWDVRENPPNKQKKEIIDKDKVYNCKPESWYSVKDGKIIKLDKNQSLPKNITEAQQNTEKIKLTVEEIKNIPKFSNYDPGTPSKVLYLKNLGKNVKTNCIKNLLNDFKDERFVVKVMTGKMKGQAFIEFKSADDASRALNVLNGIVYKEKPIVVQFGRRTNS